MQGKVRKAIKKQLQYIRRDLGYMDNLLKNNNVILSASDAELIDILTTVYEQQRYMFKNNTYTVENRIVSISQPYIRPIVRGKAKSPVEFGLDLLLTKREDTTKALIVLSIIAMNIDRLAALLLRLFKFVLSFFIFDVENRNLLEMTGY